MEYITNILEYIKIIMNFSETAIAILGVTLLALFLAVKFFLFVSNRIDNKDDKQFEVLLRIIDDNDFLQRLSKQPYLVKQFFYKRFYLLKDYKVEEIEFLMSQNSLKINLYELSRLKSSNIIKFKDGHYIKKLDILTYHWTSNYRRFNIIIIVLFLLLILFSGAIFLFYFKSNILFYVSLIPLFLLEIYLLIKIEAVKTYIKTQDDIDGFLYQSEIFKNNQGNSQT